VRPTCADGVGRCRRARRAKQNRGEDRSPATTLPRLLPPPPSGGVGPLVSAPARTVGGLECGDGGNKGGGGLAPSVGAAVGALAVAAGDSATGEEWLGVGRRRCGAAGFCRPPHCR